jgi:hypothetical protein
MTSGELRDKLRKAWPAEFRDGAKRGFSGDRLFPGGFNQFPAERRNAWFAGWNVGLCDRKGRGQGQ